MSEQTAETIDSDGWLHTGDIGLIMPNGAVKIIDRKKNIFKLSQGEYVAPEKLENIYSESPLIMQIFVFGDPIESELVAIIVPDVAACTNLAKSTGFVSDSIDGVIFNQEVQHAIRDDINRLAASNKLAGFEVIKAFYVESIPFSVENGLLTPTFKMKRQAIQIKYDKILDKLYRKLKSGSTSATVLNNT
jgi:long-chain acyl-CoA synthetase